MQKFLENVRAIDLGWKLVILLIFATLVFDHAAINNNIETAQCGDVKVWFGR